MVRIQLVCGSRDGGGNRHPLKIQNDACLPLAVNVIIYNYVRIDPHWDERGGSRGRSGSRARGANPGEGTDLGTGRIQRL